MTNNAQATEFMSWLDTNLPIYLPLSLQKIATPGQLQSYMNETEIITNALNNNELTLTSAELQMESFLTALANQIAGNYVPLPTLSIPKTTIMQYVYYALPNINPAQIIDISSDGYTGIVEITYNNSLVLENYTIGKNIVSVFTTPQGFVNWYVNNRAAILSAPENIMSVLTAQYESMISPITENGITYSNNEQMQIAYFNSTGYTLIPYSINTNYAVSPAAINPITTYGLTTNELYMLLLTTTQTLTQLQINAQTLTQSSTATQSATALDNSNIGSGIVKSTEQTLNNVSTMFSSPEFYLVLGAIVLVSAVILLKT